jgi:hypothetical protein
MPELIRLYIRHVAIGFGIAAAFVAGLLYLNVGNLWHLVSTSDIGVLAVVMMVVFNGIVFSGVQFAFAVMGMAGKDDDDAGGRRDPLMQHHLVPVRIETRDPQPKR